MTNSHPIPWTTAEILEATAGELVCGDLQRAFSKVFIDSRMTADDGVFVAISGEIHDGHTFLPEVVDQGVRGLVVNRKKTEQLPLAAWKTTGVACIAVADTTRALGDMAAFNRRRSQASVVGITGSNGKTTTRQFTASRCITAVQHPGDRRKFQQRNWIALNPARTRARSSMGGGGIRDQQSRRNRQTDGHMFTGYRRHYQYRSGPPGRIGVNRRGRTGKGVLIKRSAKKRPGRSECRRSTRIAAGPPNPERRSYCTDCRPMPQSGPRMCTKMRRQSALR